MSLSFAVGAVCIVAVGLGCGFAPAIRRLIRRRLYSRGWRLAANVDERVSSGDRKWGAHGVSKLSCRQHFIVAGTSGSGKSNIQRRLMKDPLRSILPDSDRRALIYDNKGDVIPYLKQIGVQCPVFSFNPLESRTDFPRAVRWKVSRDITNPARALNLVAKLIPEDKGQNRFFSDAARILLWSVCNSFIRHSPDDWEFSDLVFASLNSKRVMEILNRDAEGRDDLQGVFRRADEGNITADNIFSTMYSRMAFYRPIAALWQRTEDSLSMRDWVTSESILLLGEDETIDEALNLVNSVIFRTFVEEVSIQQNSDTRETFLWLDELRLCRSILESGKLNNFVLKMRSKGGIFVGGFQDIEGFRHAIGSDELANEIIGQCSHKALLRMESAETAAWASDLLGKFETIESFESYQSELGNRTRSVNEQRTLKENVLPSEFFAIHEPSPVTGVQGYFLSPGRNPYGRVVPAIEFEEVIVSDFAERNMRALQRPETHQILIPWSAERLCSLRIADQLIATPEITTGQMVASSAALPGSTSRLDELSLPIQQSGCRQNIWESRTCPVS